MTLLGPLLLTLAAPGAEECGQPLRVRATQPSDGAIGVPVDARVLVGLIGLGTADEFAVEVSRISDPPANLAGTTTTWCYDHERPTEVHCWIAWEPEETLAPSSEHLVQARSTDLYPGEPSLHAVRFTTGEAVARPVEAAPRVEIAESWTEASEGDPCRWASSRRFRIDVVGEPPGDGDGTFQVWHLAPDGAEPLVHTVFVPADGAHPGLKQYLDAEAPTTGCFRVVQEDAAGTPSPSTTACWEEPLGPGETDAADTASPPPAASGCGCGAPRPATWWLALPILVGTRRRARGHGAAGGSEPAPSDSRAGCEVRERATTSRSASSIR